MSLKISKEKKSTTAKRRRRSTRPWREGTCKVLSTLWSVGFSVAELQVPNPQVGREAYIQGRIDAPRARGRSRREVAKISLASTAESRATQLESASNRLLRKRKGHASDAASRGTRGPSARRRVVATEVRPEADRRGWRTDRRAATSHRALTTWCVPMRLCPLTGAHRPRPLWAIASCEPSLRASGRRSHRRARPWQRGLAACRLSPRSPGNVWREKGKNLKPQHAVCGAFGRRGCSKKCCSPAVSAEDWPELPIPQPVAQLKLQRPVEISNRFAIYEPDTDDEPESPSGSDLRVHAVLPSTHGQDLEIHHWRVPLDACPAGTFQKEVGVEHQGVSAGDVRGASVAGGARAEAGAAYNGVGVVDSVSVSIMHTIHRDFRGRVGGVDTEQNPNESIASNGLHESSSSVGVTADTSAKADSSSDVPPEPRSKDVSLVCGADSAVDTKPPEAYAYLKSKLDEYGIEDVGAPVNATKAKKKPRRKTQSVRFANGDVPEGKAEVEKDEPNATEPTKNTAPEPRLETAAFLAELLEGVEGADAIRQALMEAVGVVAKPSPLQLSVGEAFSKTMPGVLSPGAGYLMYGSEPPGELMRAESEWEDVIFEVALDSGCTDHVCDELDAPGYQREESEGQRRGQQFTIGDGTEIPNRGQLRLNFEAESGKGKNSIQSIFQVVKVTRPLMSVGRICDGDLDVLFKKLYALVLDQAGREVCQFERPNGGLYTAKFTLKRPTQKKSPDSPFGRPE